MRYEEYKECDCGWLDKIPSGWSTIPIKRTVKNILTSFIDGDWIESDVITSDGIRYLTTGNVGALEYKEQGHGHISEETFKELNCSEVFPGDMLISRLNEPIGRTCIVPDLGNRIVVAVDNVIYRPDENKYDKRYLMYQMNCLPYTENANFIARGSTMSRISRTMLGSIKLCIPTLQEQQAIASYLDEKCGKINGAIDVQKKKIDLLNELKQTIITNAVTKGLNPDAPMKDSGVEWIGQVPAHWEVMKMNFACKVITDYVASGSFADLRDNVTYLDEPDFAMLVRTADLSQKDKNISRVYINRASYDFLSNSNLYGGEIVLPNIGASIGDVYMVPYGLYDNMSLAPNSIMVKSKTSDEYMYYFFFSKVGRESLNIIGTAAAQGKFNKTELRALRVPIPPSEEQDLIINHIKEKIAPIETQISKANRRIELLNELKQSIITEAVTGKIKVC